MTPIMAVAATPASRLSSLVADSRDPSEITFAERSATAPARGAAASLGAVAGPAGPPAVSRVMLTGAASAPGCKQEQNAKVC